MVDIQWAEPPARRRGRPEKWLAVCDALRERPGEWALIRRGRTSDAQPWRDGRIAGTMPGEFEATTRSAGDGKYDIYVRYVGGTR